MASVLASAVVSLLLVSCAAITDDSTAAVQTKVHAVPEPLTDSELMGLKDLKLGATIEATMNPLIGWLLGHQQVVNVIDIGVGESGFGAGPVGPYDGVLLSPKVFAVLVEPNPPRFHRLNKTCVEDINWKETPRFELIEAAISTGKDHKDQAFYTVSHDLYTDRAAPAADAAAGAVGELLHPDAPAWLETEVGSLHRDTTLSYATSAGLSVEEFDKYVKEVKVDALTPKELMHQVGIGPYQVDILRTSAEGSSDFQIIEAFLKVGGFAPSMIVFHTGKSGEPGHMIYDDMERLIEILEAHGYSHHCTREGVAREHTWGKWECPTDAMAWRLHKSSGYGPR